MRVLFIFFLFFAVLSSRAQSYLEYDTMRKKEISASFQLVLGFFVAGAEPYQRGLHFGYKIYKNNRQVLRFGLKTILMPGESSGYIEYVKPVDSMFMYHLASNYHGPILQSSFGFEKIYKVNRLMHGVGIEAFANWQWTHRSSYYFLSPFNSYENVDPFPQKYIDTLGFRERGTWWGLGCQAFYSLRYRISSRWYLSSTVGPRINFGFYRGRKWINGQPNRITNYDFRIDWPDIFLISDISLAYRF
jgi:hypothetical protein